MTGLHGPGINLACCATNVKPYRLNYGFKSKGVKGGVVVKKAYTITPHVSHDSHFAVLGLTAATTTATAGAQ